MSATPKLGRTGFQWLLLVLALSMGAMWPTYARADPAKATITDLCKRSFSKTSMPASEAVDFCECVSHDVISRINSSQRNVLRQVDKDLAIGTQHSLSKLGESGVRDLVIASQARCEASFYPPSDPILITSGNLSMTMRCDTESQSPEAFIYVRNATLLTKAELKAMDAKMERHDYRPEVASVRLKFDQQTEQQESWEIDLSGQIVGPEKAHSFITRVRNAKQLRVEIRKGAQKHSAVFALSGKVHPRWVACQGRVR